MHVVATARLVLARRPWLYWAIIASLAVALGLAVNSQLAAVDAARDEWGTTRSVLVADRPLRPGDLIDVRRVQLPLAMLPTGALTELPDGASLFQRVGAGDVLTDLDITDQPGPAARAGPGTVVVAVADPLSRTAHIGLTVLVAADGQVLAASATIVDVQDGVTFVAVAASDGPAVAAAAQSALATLLYVP